MNEKVSFLVLARITECHFHLFLQPFSLMLKDRSFINGFFFFFLAVFQLNQQLKMEEESNGKCCSSLLSLMNTVSVSELIASHICCRLYLF